MEVSASSISRWFLQQLGHFVWPPVLSCLTYYRLRSPMRPMPCRLRRGTWTTTQRRTSGCRTSAATEDACVLSRPPAAASSVTFLGSAPLDSANAAAAAACNRTLSHGGRPPAGKRRTGQPPGTTCGASGFSPGSSTPTTTRPTPASPPSARRAAGHPTGAPPPAHAGGSVTHSLHPTAVTRPPGPRVLLQRPDHRFPRVPPGLRQQAQDLLHGAHPQRRGDPVHHRGPPAGAQKTRNRALSLYRRLRRALWPPESLALLTRPGAPLSLPNPGRAQGSGYFDVRDGADQWIRVACKKGDMIVLPEARGRAAGRLHCAAFRPRRVSRSPLSSARGFTIDSPLTRGTTQRCVRAAPRASAMRPLRELRRDRRA